MATTRCATALTSCRPCVPCRMGSGCLRCTAASAAYPEKPRAMSSSRHHPFGRWEVPGALKDPRALINKITQAVWK